MLIICKNLSIKSEWDNKLFQKNCDINNVVMLNAIYMLQIGGNDLSEFKFIFLGSGKTCVRQLTVGKEDWLHLERISAEIMLIFLCCFKCEKVGTLRSSIWNSWATRYLIFWQNFSHKNEKETLIRVKLYKEVAMNRIWTANYEFLKF